MSKKKNHGKHGRHGKKGNHERHEKHEKGKKPLVPELRFPEFRGSGEWKKYRLADIAERITEKVGSELLTTLSITAGLGFVSQAEKFSRDISGKQYKNYILLKEGEFSYNKGNSKRFPQGCIYKLKEYKKAAVPNAFLSFRFNKNYVSDFYNGYFNSNFHGIQLRKFITSGARSDGLLNISSTDFFSIILPTPPEKSEQQKIADCLTSLDELITAEAGKLEAYKAHKKGLMQKLFPAEGKTVPEWRFPEFRGKGEWEVKRLGNLSDVRDGTHDSPKFCNTGRPLVTSKNLLKNGLLDLDNVNLISEVDYNKINKRSKVDIGDILFGMIGTIGNPVMVKSEGFAIKNVALVKQREALLNSYLVHFLNSQYIATIFSVLNMGNSQKFIALGQIRNLSLMVPSIHEQQRIADCLSSLDNLITAQAQKIDALKDHKKGLMQGLFPSGEEE